MDALLYYPASALIRLLQALPLPAVAWIGRRAGGLAYWLDRRHRRVALENLHRCFGVEKSGAEIRALARENFRRLGENYCGAIKTAAMTWPELAPYVECVGAEKFAVSRSEGKSPSCVVAIGHFGNFELYARYGHFVPGLKSATTYRALKQPRLNRLLLSMRERSDCLFFERRTEAGALKAALSKGGGLLLGLLADQHAGQGGISVPLFGQNCSTTAAPAVLALRYNCRLFTGVCYRTGLGRWRIEPGDEIPTHNGQQPRSVTAITAEINKAFEAAIRRDPANWFWVHKRWKPFRGRHNFSNAAPPDQGQPVSQAGTAVPLR